MRRNIILDDNRNFDNQLFTINNRDAAVMSPPWREKVEIVFETFDSAGGSLNEVSGTNAGVYNTSPAAL